MLTNHIINCVSVFRFVHDFYIFNVLFFQFFFLFNCTICSFIATTKYFLAFSTNWLIFNKSSHQIGRCTPFIDSGARTSKWWCYFTTCYLSRNATISRCWYVHIYVSMVSLSIFHSFLWLSNSNNLFNQCTK